MVALIPFTAADIEQLLGWITSYEELPFWTASSFGIR